MKNLFIDNINWEITDWNLDNSHTHIFKINIAEKFKDIYSKYEDVLSDNEILKSEKYLQVRDRKRFITSKYFLRLILSKILYTTPSELQFSQHYNNKPKLSGIEFNVSHSGDKILIAISPKPIGIDVESLTKPFDFESIIETCFHPDEKKYLIKADRQNFYTFWTRKEAVLKATGEGLVDNLESINTFQNRIERNTEYFELKSFLIDNDYVASLAFKSSVHNAIKFWII
ncbi:4'-phosphopantetheinyl transferase superfamily protein [Pedobacter sp. Leaf170]|uniref:4'-phosphopantetheinyl transferase family protein n=1 Tax=Pedobacter sp. Leaf170 TaxID=2876558 RepID=UPI001E31DC28|nr:4'-phosphopantetheinyl transferase superfamily protein [Pedobacter sp. Leaf170]